MRKISLLAMLLLLCSLAFAQNDKEKQAIRNKIWSQQDQEFSATSVPAEWETEDVVILAKKIDYEIQKRSIMLVLDETFTMHMRIKVLNNDGVKEYSELQFEVPRSDYDGLVVLGPNLDSKFFFGARIEKKNGQITELKETDLVKMELQSNSSRYEKHKLAIPTLEPGDIIDYYYRLDVPRMVQHYFESPAFDFLLSGRFPIVHQEYNILLNRKCTINAGSYNGAPEFKMASQDRNFTHYQLIDRNRAKYKSERWTYDYQNMPFFKFQTYFIGKKKGIPFNSFPNDTEQMAKTIGKDKLNDFAERLVYYRTQASILDLKATHAYMNKHYKKEKDPVVLAQAAYYFLRNNNMAASYEYGLMQNREMWSRINENYFVSVFSNYLKSKKINHEILFTTQRNSGFQIKKLLFKDDMRMLVAVNDKDGKRMFFNNFTFYNNPNELDAEIEGMPAYAVNMLEARKKRTVKDISLPISGSSQNREQEIAKIQIEMEAEPALRIERTTAVYGQRKIGTQQQLVTGYTYLDASKKHNLEVDLQNFCKTNGYLMSGAERRKMPEKKAQLIQEQQERLQKDYEASLQSEFSTKNISLTDVKLLEAGIWQDAPVVEYQDSFVMKDLIQRAGPNYLLEIGKLIGGQMAIEEKELDRVHNIQLEYAREFENQIELQIPSGYVLEGVERLKANVQNGAGVFTSTVSQEGDKLIITTKKTYLKADVVKEDWKDMVAFLDAAYQFSQQKLLLKKSPQARK